MRWFGAYLLWHEVNEGHVDGAAKESWRQRIVVRHLRGRKQPYRGEKKIVEGQDEVLD